MLLCGPVGGDRGGGGVSATILNGDCRELLATLDAVSVQCCVTSPPYFGLRDYGVAGQIGLESTPDAFVAKLVAVFAEVRRVLADAGTLWLNLGDSYAGGGKGGNPPESEHQKQKTNRGSLLHAGLHESARQAGAVDRSWQKPPAGYKAKDLMGVPWLVAFALRADGWYLRSDIIWHKPNPMPESVTDRPTKAHEYLFLLSKNERYYYDADAIAEPSIHAGDVKRTNGADGYSGDVNDGRTRDGFKRGVTVKATRNKRDVWTVPAHPFAEAHFATFPPALIEPCILAGSRPGDTVLDPFGGAGTTGLVADRLGRNSLLIELNPDYANMARARIHDDAPLFGASA
jgi:DNA modification methylase